jgi:hypothetical protein
MASTGLVLAGTGANNADIGLTQWLTTGNITADDTSDATCNAGASSQYLVARNFGFSIPAGATIDGITVQINASEHSSGTESLNAQLQNDTGTLFGSSKSATINGTAKNNYSYGSATDKWGATLTTTIVNDVDFGVRFWFTTAHDVRVNFVKMQVNYTPFRRVYVVA